MSRSLSLSLSLRHSSPSLFEEARAQKIEIRMQAGHACVPVNNLQWTKREGAMTEDEPEFNNTHYNSSLVRMFLRLPYDDLSFILPSACSLYQAFSSSVFLCVFLDTALVAYAYTSTSFALASSLSFSSLFSLFVMLFRSPSFAVPLSACFHFCIGQSFPFHIYLCRTCVAWSFLCLYLSSLLLSKVYLL